VVTKTALNIDTDKVQRAAEVLGTKGTTATIDAALTEIIARDARARLLERMRTLTDEQRDAILHSWD
jgi:Arc/MetJ family transcription regulator